MSGTRDLTEEEFVRAAFMASYLLRVMGPLDFLYKCFSMAKLSLLTREQFDALSRTFTREKVNAPRLAPARKIPAYRSRKPVTLPTV